jgi:hypothetical protein
MRYKSSKLSQYLQWVSYGCLEDKTSLNFVLADALGHQMELELDSRKSFRAAPDPIMILEVSGDACARALISAPRTTAVQLFAG